MEAENRGFSIKANIKVQRFSQLQTSLQFCSFDDVQLFKQRFFESDLGKLYLAIPWSALVKELGLKEKRKGRHQLFPPQGRLAVMFLKSYSGLSDPKLIEQLNGNVEWQFFVVYCWALSGSQTLK